MLQVEEGAAEDLKWSLGIMASVQVLLLQLLLVSLASASHHMGGRTHFTYRGRNSDGTYSVDIYNRDTYDRCTSSLHWFCYQGNCGTIEKYHPKATIDNSTNAPSYENLWCETEMVQTRRLPSNRPFYLRASSCCWIQTRNAVYNWRLLSMIDLGTRYDTKEPNRSPDVGILPFLRVPQNCPRTFKLVNFDPDGDKVQCRYANLYNIECSRCDQPSGFSLNKETCVLQYNGASYDYRIFGFEMMVEDFPRKPVTLTYSDGHQSVRAPMSRWKRGFVNPYAPYYYQPTTTATTSNQWPRRRWQTHLAMTTNPKNWRRWQPTTPAMTTNPQNWRRWQRTTPAMTTKTQNWRRWQRTTPAMTTKTQNWRRWQRTSPAMTTNPKNWGRWQRTTPAMTTNPQNWGRWQRTTPPMTTNPKNWGRWQPTTPAMTTKTQNWRRWQRTTPPMTTNPKNWGRWQPTTPAMTTKTQNWRRWQPTTPAMTTNPQNWGRWQRTTAAQPTAAPTTNQWPWRWQPTTAAQPTAAPTTNQWPWWWQPTTAAPLVASYEPFSKLPLHFSLLVDKPVPSCAPGLYLPKFVSPTPANGGRIHAEVDKEVEIRVKAQTAYSVIDNIIFSGPQRTRKHKNTHNEFLITWTPKPDDLGHHYVICFAVEAKRGSDIYQSDMRCVIVDVGKKTVEAKVICSESTMRVEVAKSSFPRLHEDHLRLSDPSNVVCSLQTHSNSSHVIAIIPLNGCGTQIEEDDEYLKFKNEITTFDNLRDVVTRKHLLEVQFYCQYPKHGNVTQSFLAHRKSVTVWEKGMGKFTYQFEFYSDLQFRTMMDPNSYPLEYDLGDRIYMQIEATSSVNNTELFVESCRAAPYDNPNYKPVYSIIENGCKVDQTVQNHTTDHGKQFRFSMEAFKFIGLHDQVYISCSVLMCKAGDPNTRCAKGCMNPNSWHRGKREAVTQSSPHLVSQGPLRLARSAERADSSAMNLNLNMVFVAGCLLAAVGMISGVVLYKSKMSKVRYKPLSTTES